MTKETNNNEAQATTMNLEQPKEQSGITYWQTVLQYETAAESGDVEAMMNLAEAFFGRANDGEPLPDTYHSPYYFLVKAHELSPDTTPKSANNNAIDATKVFDWVYNEVSNKDCEEHTQRDYEHNEGLEYLLSLMLRLGVGTKVCVKQADYWLAVAGEPENKQLIERLLRTISKTSPTNQL